MTTVTERVAAGAGFLDEHDPEWWREIDLDELDLGSSYGCILGQRCPMEVYNRGELGDTRYTAMAKHLSGIVSGRDADRWAAARGFQSGDADPDDEGDAEYAALTAEWKRVITERRSA
jgi:hypothetical protein